MKNGQKWKRETIIKEYNEINVNCSLNVKKN